MGNSSRSMESTQTSDSSKMVSPSAESTIEIMVHQPSVHDLNSPPPNSCSNSLPDDETVRNDIVSAVEDIITPRVQQNLAAFKAASELSFDLINEWVDLVGDEAGLHHISAGAPIIAEVVADVLEQEAAGAASTATEIVQAIAEVVAENILNPAALIEQLNASNLMNESMPSCPMANVSIPRHDDLDNEQMPVDMLMDQSMKSQPSRSNRSNRSFGNLNMSNIMDESMPSCPMANVSIPRYDDLGNESMPSMASSGQRSSRSMNVNDLMHESMPAMVSGGGCNRSGSNRMDVSDLMGHDSVAGPGMTSSRGNRSMRRHLLDESIPGMVESVQRSVRSINMSNLMDESMPAVSSGNRSMRSMNVSNLMNESMPAAMDQSTEAQLQNQLKQLENLINHERAQSESPGSIVVNESQTKTIGTIQRNECGQIVPTNISGTITTKTTTIEPTRQASMDFLEDEVMPDELNNLSCEMQGNISRQNISGGNRSLAGRQSMGPGGMSAERRAELEAQLANMSIRFPDIDDEMGDLMNESELSCEIPSDMPEDLQHVRGDELFQEVPSDERAMRIADAFISDRLGGTNRVDMLVNRRNFYDRRILLIAQTWMDEAMRSARHIFRADFGSPEFPMNHFVEFIRSRVLDEVRSMRFDQMQMHRQARGEEPLMPFGPLLEHEHPYPIGPRNWTEDDLYGPWPEHMAVHVYQEPEYWGPHPQDRTVYIEEEQLPVYGPELMYGPWGEDYYEVPQEPRRISMIRPPAAAQVGAVPKRRSEGSALRAPSAGSGLRAPSSGRQSMGPTLLQVPQMPMQMSRPSGIARPSMGGSGLKPPSAGGLRAPSTAVGGQRPTSPSGQRQMSPVAAGGAAQAGGACGLRQPTNMKQQATMRQSTGSVGMRAPSGSSRATGGGGLRPPSAAAAAACARPGAQQQKPSRLSAPAAGACRVGGTGGGAAGTCEPSGLQRQASRLQASRLQAPSQNSKASCARKPTGDVAGGSKDRKGMSMRRG